MAKGKWNPFTQQVPATQDSQLPPPPLPTLSADGKQFGLENFGNTCYANSVLQALYFCRPFRDLVIQHTDPYGSLRQAFAPQPTNTANSTSTNISTPARRKHERKPTIDVSSPNGVPQTPTPPVPSSPRSLFSALRSLYVYISQHPAEKGTVAPRVFIERLRELNEAFRNTMHQDAHEFLNYLLNKIVEEIQEEKKHQLTSAEDLSRSVNSSSDASQSMIAGSSSSAFRPSGSTFIHQIFEGVLTSETRCLTCENVSSRDESFLDLSIDIEQNSSVTACLRQFSASEMLCQKNKFFCDACCDLQEAEKRMKIKQLPNVLALHLKRFKYQEEVQRYIKLTYRVAFPLELRLFNTVDGVSNPDRLYQLFAIVVHIGNGPNHGHYISIVKTMGTWLVFDDETVDVIKESDIPKYFGESNSGSAYVLYYQAADLDPTALGLRPPSPQPVVVNHNTEPPQYSMSDSPASTSQTLPPLPPGLDCEPRSPAVPSISPQPSIPPIIPQDPSLSSTPKSPRKSPSQVLKLSLGSPLSSTRALATCSSTSAAPLSPKKSGLLRPARTIAQSKVTEEKPNSPGNPITSPLAFPKEDPASHDPPLTNGGGKEKEEKRIPSWFRRKSLKSTDKLRPKSETATEQPPLPIDILGTVPAQPAVLSPAKDSRGLTEPLAMNVTSRLNFGRPSTASGKLHSSSHREAFSPLSTTHSVRTATSSSHSSDQYSRALPPIPGSPHVSKVSQAPPSSFSRGSSDLVYPQRRHYRDPESPLSHNVPSRPATSSGPVGADASPSRLLNGSAHLMPVTNGQTVHQMNGGAGLFSGISSPRTGKTGKSGITGRPKSAHGLNVPSLASASNAASMASTSIRRATRKLSLSAPMLGFGKKDRSKDKEREGDHEPLPTSPNGRTLPSPPILNHRPLAI